VEFNTALYTYLSTYAGLSAIIGTRIYPDTLPQNVAYPAATYQYVDDDEIDTFEQPNTLISPTYQFDSYAKTRAVADSIADQLRLAFKNYSGVMGGTGGVTVSGVELVSRNTSTETDRNETIYRTIIEFKIYYQE